MEFINIWDKIEAYETITIFRHVRPDGDAIGSQIGLKELILGKFCDKKVFVLGETSKQFHSLLGKMDEGVCDEDIKQSLAIVLDVANCARVDDQRFLTAKEIIKMDHHVFVETYGTIDLVDTSYIATCEMIADLAKANLILPNEFAATALLCGLITDSGRFLFPNTSKRTFELVSMLLDCGGELFKIYSTIYTSKEEDVRFKGYCQYRFTKTLDGVAYNAFSYDELKKMNINPNFAAAIVNVLADIEGVKLFVHFAELEDGKVRVEFRSKKIPVNEIAAKYGGGGHKLASGTMLKSFAEIEQVIDDLNALASEEKIYE